MQSPPRREGMVSPQAVATTISSMAHGRRRPRSLDRANSQASERSRSLSSRPSDTASHNHIYFSNRTSLKSSSSHGATAISTGANSSKFDGSSARNSVSDAMARFSKMNDLIRAETSGGQVSMNEHMELVTSQNGTDQHPICTNTAEQKVRDAASMLASSTSNDRDDRTDQKKPKIEDNCSEDRELLEPMDMDRDLSLTKPSAVHQDGTDAYTGDSSEIEPGAAHEDEIPDGNSSEIESGASYEGGTPEYIDDPSEIERERNSHVRIYSSNDQPSPRDVPGTMARGDSQASDPAGLENGSRLDDSESSAGMLPVAVTAQRREDLRNEIAAEMERAYQNRLAQSQRQEQQQQAVQSPQLLS